MAQWADASTANDIVHSSWDVELQDFDPNYDVTYDLEANCPMCRTHTTASPDTTLAKQLEKKYPLAYAERRLEEEVERGSRVGQNGVEGVMILIGNKHKLIRGSEDANEHDWTFFVRTSRPELVEEVRIELVGSSIAANTLADISTAPYVSTSSRCPSPSTVSSSPIRLGLLHTRGRDHTEGTLYLDPQCLWSETKEPRADVDT